MDFIAGEEARVADIYRLAFAATMVSYSNYSYEPSLGRKAAVGRPDVDDYDVAKAMGGKVLQMVEDAIWYQEVRDSREREDGQIFEQSFFEGYIESGSGERRPPYHLSAVSEQLPLQPEHTPPSVLAGFLHFTARHETSGGAQLRYAYWQNARDREHVALDPSIEDEEIRQALAEVRSRNPDKGIYGGSGWANYAARYFNDCVRFVAGAAWCMRSGATALVVIGNSILQGVPIPTDRFLARIAESRGFEVADIHVPRQARVGNSIINSSVRAGKANGGATLRVHRGVEARVMPELWDPLTYENLMAGTVAHFERQERIPLDSDRGSPGAGNLRALL